MSYKGLLCHLRRTPEQDRSPHRCTAYLHAETREDEKYPVRYPEGMREYDEHGNGLYGVLEKNLYGSLVASRRFSQMPDARCQIGEMRLSAEWNHQLGAVPDARPLILIAK